MEASGPTGAQGLGRLSQFGDPGADIQRLWPFVTSDQGRRPGRRRNGTGFGAPDVRNIFHLGLSRVRARRPGDLLGTFVSLQKYLARGRNFPSA